MHYDFQSHRGITGVVRNDHGQELPGAWVTVDSMLSDTYTAQAGDFWRILLPGRYQVSVSAPGYIGLTKVGAQQGDCMYHCQK